MPQLWRIIGRDIHKEDGGGGTVFLVETAGVGKMNILRIRLGGGVYGNALTSPAWDGLGTSVEGQPILTSP